MSPTDRRRERKRCDLMCYDDGGGVHKNKIEKEEEKIIILTWITFFIYFRLHKIQVLS